MAKVRKGYPSDVTDEEWWFVLPCLLLCREGSGQRDHDLRSVFNAVRYMARSGCSWRLVPNDLPPWYTVYQQFGTLSLADIEAFLQASEGEPTP